MPDVVPPHALLNANEVKSKISALRPLAVEDVGNSVWIEQHQALEALNLQAHADAQHQASEVVKDELVAQDRISLLVVDIAISDVWTQHALKFLRAHIAREVDTLLSYAVLHHESMVASLMEVMLHHQDAAVCLTEESALELVDWCSRKLAFWKEGEAALGSRPGEVLDDTWATCWILIRLSGSCQPHKLPSFLQSFLDNTC